MVNASPDLRAQVGGFALLHPRPGAVRNSPIQGVLLTNADLDHILGVQLLREGARLHLHATPGVRRSLEWLEHLLAPYCGLDWHHPTESFTPLRSRIGSPSGLSYRIIGLPAAPPRYDTTSLPGSDQSVAFEIRDDHTQGVLLIAPDVGGVTPELHSALQQATAVLFDGTFWSEDELRRSCPDAPFAHEMGHLPIADGSLEILRDCPSNHKIYLHINNTNPILALDSAERAAVENAGLIVGCDDFEFEL